MAADERWNRGIRQVHDIPIRRIACSPWDAEVAWRTTFTPAGASWNTI